MPRNGSGVYSKPAGTTAVAGAVATASFYNTLMDDFAAEVTASLPRAGTAPMTGILDMGNFVVDNVGNASADDHALNRVTADGRYNPFPTTPAKTSGDSPYTQVAGDKGLAIEWDASGGACTHNLLAVATAGDGFLQYIVKTDSSTNAVTIDGSAAETINGAATITLTQQWESVLLLCDGTEWWVIGGSSRAVSGAVIASSTLDAAVAKGTWTASGTWTVPAMTLAGAITGADQTVSAINLKDYGEVHNAIGDFGGGMQDIDLTAGNMVSATVSTSTCTFSFSNPTASDELCSFTLKLTNGGSQTVNWPTEVDWAGGTSPTLTTAGVDFLEFWTVDGGTTWYGALVGADFK